MHCNGLYNRKKIENRDLVNEIREYYVVIEKIKLFKNNNDKRECSFKNHDLKNNYNFYVLQA